MIARRGRYDKTAVMVSAPPPEADQSRLADDFEDSLAQAALTVEVPNSIDDLRLRIEHQLGVTPEQAQRIILESERLYIGRMRDRFSRLRVSERIKRTNPFLLRIRGAKTVRDWATLQVESALYASEEEAVGHLLESIARICFPGATEPTHPDDFDLEVRTRDGDVNGYQIKMSWDCMPMSSRKNLSNTIRKVRQEYDKVGTTFVGYFAPCYGRARTSQAPGQEYVSLASREFWTLVGSGDVNFDVKVGEVCALLCATFRLEILDSLVPNLLNALTQAAISEIGDSAGNINYDRLFRRINR